MWRPGEGGGEKEGAAGNCGVCGERVRVPASLTRLQRESG